MRFVALCRNCHLATHMGRAGIIGKKPEMIMHMMSVRKWTMKEYLEHEREAFALWRERNLIKWKLDIELITLNGLRLTKKAK